MYYTSYDDYQKGLIMDCGCGRSPTGKCIGWHDLTEEDYLKKLELFKKKSQNKGKKQK